MVPLAAAQRICRGPQVSIPCTCMKIWLNEGLAVAFDRTVAGRSRPIVDHDSRERHLAFWNPENMQKFWAGVSFREPGDSNELSYRLAEIVLNLLISKGKDLAAFVKAARR